MKAIRFLPTYRRLPLHLAGERPPEPKGTGSAHLPADCDPGFLRQHEARIAAIAARVAAELRPICRGHSGARPKCVSGRGAPGHRAKLTSEQVDELRRLYATGGYTCRQLGAMYGVSKGQANKIARGAEGGRWREFVPLQAIEGLAP